MTTSAREAFRTADICINPGGAWYFWAKVLSNLLEVVKKGD
jgi:hypothetical protein